MFFIYRWFILPPTFYPFIVLSSITGFYLAFFFIISHNFLGVKTYRTTQKKEFIYQQVETASSIQSPILGYINGGLNYQIEHHLFPGYCHTHYPKLSKIVRQFCAKHNIKYTSFPTLKSNLISTWKRFRSLSRNN